MKLKLQYGNQTVYGEVYDDVIIQIDVPYWVSPNVVKAVEDGICAGQTKGEVVGDGYGMTSSGLYRWELISG